MAATQFSRPFTIWDCLDHRRPLGRRIDDERRRLQKANTILVALEYTLNEEEIEPIVAADAANVVRELIEHAIDGLDTVSLARGEARPPATGSGSPGEPIEQELQAEEQSEQNETADESGNDGTGPEDDGEPDVDESDIDD